ncbi:unnamed protein product [Durusdinium trenchii]|uniref:Uncharacterized protein n=1 Tax=Durusdinium trenchii TaxID=1381693 RepID=A0ABP0SQ11_9DINO
MAWYSQQREYTDDEWKAWEGLNKKWRPSGSGTTTKWRQLDREKKQWSYLEFKDHQPSTKENLAEHLKALDKARARAAAQLEALEKAESPRQVILQEGPLEKGQEEEAQSPAQPLEKGHEAKAETLGKDQAQAVSLEKENAQAVTPPQPLEKGQEAKAETLGKDQAQAVSLEKDDAQAVSLEKDGGGKEKVPLEKGEDDQASWTTVSKKKKRSEEPKSLEKDKPLVVVDWHQPLEEPSEEEDLPTEEEALEMALKKAKKARDAVCSARADLEDALEKASPHLSRKGKAGAAGLDVELGKVHGLLKGVLQGKKKGQTSKSVQKVLEESAKVIKAAKDECKELMQIGNKAQSVASKRSRT